MNIIESPSKNYWIGRKGYSPLLIVVHITDGFYPSDLDWLRGKDPRSQVSSHYYIAPTRIVPGIVHRLVQDEDTAWHAGTVVEPSANLLKDSNGNIVNPNYYSIGIEVSLKPPLLPQEEQLEELKELIRDLSHKHNIPLNKDHIVGHYEIRRGKTCPAPINVPSLLKEMTVIPPEMVVKEEFKNKIIDFIKSL